MTKSLSMKPFRWSAMTVNYTPLWRTSQSWRSEHATQSWSSPNNSPLRVSSPFGLWQTKAFPSTKPRPSQPADLRRTCRRYRNGLNGNWPTQLLTIVVDIYSKVQINPVKPLDCLSSRISSDLNQPRLKIAPHVTHFTSVLGASTPTAIFPALDRLVLKLVPPHFGQA